MTVALYIRVSTDEQAKDGFSIEHQKQRLAAFCESQGWNSYEFYIDDGYTGTNLNRPQLTRLIRHVRNRSVNIVLVHRLDRLSRKQKDVLYLLEDVFDSNDVAFRSATEPFDTSTPLGKAMLGILAVFAQLERDTIVERATSGKHERIRQGLWYGGPIPYGYDWSTEEQRLVVNPAQARIIQEMYEHALRGQPYTTIAKWASRRSRERLFGHHKTLLYMLTNPLYMGKLNQRGVHINGLHEAIVSEETWQAVQKEIRIRKNGRAIYGKYLLSGILVCGVCGSSMKHIRIQDRRFNPPKIRDYYLCSTKHSGHSCSSRYVPQQELEDRVINTLKDKSVDPDMVIQELSARREDINSVESTIDALNRQLDEVKVKLERWYAAIESGMDLGKVMPRIHELEDEQKAIMLQLDELDGADYEETNTRILDSLHQIGQQWDNMTNEERNAVLHAAVKTITVNSDGTLVFTWDA